MNTAQDAIKLLTRARHHITDWWRPEGSLPPAKSYELVEDIDNFLKEAALPALPPVQDHSEQVLDMVALASKSEVVGYQYLYTNQFGQDVCDFHVPNECKDSIKATYALCRCDHVPDSGKMIIPEGWKLLKDSTQDERSYPEMSTNENGNYFNTCFNCKRTFVGHKRMLFCRVCTPPEGVK